MATISRPIAVKLDVEMRERLNQLAKARCRSAHWLMREAIARYVESEEKREALRQDGIKAWNDYQATGLHATQEESDAWLACLETGEDVEPPPCHE
jgi:predicted transcriptional regulator